MKEAEDGLPHINEVIKIDVIASLKLNNLLNIFFMKRGIILCTPNFTSNVPTIMDGNIPGSIFNTNMLQLFITLCITVFEFNKISTSIVSRKYINIISFFEVIFCNLHKYIIYITY